MRARALLLARRTGEQTASSSSESEPESESESPRRGGPSVPPRREPPRRPDEPDAAQTGDGRGAPIERRLLETLERRRHPAGSGRTRAAAPARAPAHPSEPSAEFLARTSNASATRSPRGDEINRRRSNEGRRAPKSRILAARVARRRLYSKLAHRPSNARAPPRRAPSRRRPRRASRGGIEARTSRCAASAACVACRFAACDATNGRRSGADFFSRRKRRSHHRKRRG